jgi:hypothetical protein
MNLSQFISNFDHYQESTEYPLTEIKVQLSSGDIQLMQLVKWISNYCMALQWITCTTGSHTSAAVGKQVTHTQHNTHTYVIIYITYAHIQVSRHSIYKLRHSADTHIYMCV